MPAGTSYHNSNSVSQTSGTVTMTTVDANSVVIVSVCTDDNGTASTFSVPTATGLTFVQIGSTLRSINNLNIAVFRAYTAVALGSTLITATWTQSNDWVIGATDYTGTAGTAANNGSDAIGTTNTATSASSPVTVTVNSSSHDNSSYLGIVAGGVVGGGGVITKGASYTANVPSTSDGTWLTVLTELSTSPVTPPANTVINATDSSTVAMGIFGIELLIASGAVAGWKSPTAGPSYAI